MKLIALVATAATTVTARRVITPAPGFINEQGGYWADQSSDQSVQRPQQGQPPQIQPPHSTQAPQPDNRQCCRDIKWTQFGGDIVWLKHNGQTYDAMPVYEMTWNDEKTFMWWNPVGAPDNRPQKAVQGYWVISTEVGGSDGISGDEGYRNCPDRSVFPGNEDGKNTFECESPPPPVKSCDDVKNQSHIFLQTKSSLLGSLTCRVSDLMSQVVSTQLEHFLVKYDHDTQQYLRDGYYNMVQGWKDMADSSTCGFRSTVPNKPGFIGNCLTMCLEIRDSDSDSAFRSVLTTFDTFFRDRFPVWQCKYHSELMKFQKYRFTFFNINLSCNKSPSMVKNHL